ncbi:N-acetyl sugar amidotransferase [Tenacibaculum halocynthiae]|uniref:N-acetyl sugar amidotransferase n=1 Tax=Tenacibaculum halocynthiae TaxID=1254437 RepID=UPI003D655844
MQSNNSKYQICTKTVMDTSDPWITFDKDGVCNYVNGYNHWNENIRLKEEEAKKALDQMINKMIDDGKGKEYDCIMGLSGGVDSSYLAYRVVKDWGLRPLIVHVDAGWNSELAVNNIENIVNSLGIDLHTLVVDWDVMKDLQRSFVKASVPNCDIPQDHSFIAGLYSEAKKYKIKHILNGGNMATESILPIAWGHDASDLVHIKDIHRRFGERSLKKFPKINFFKRAILNPYLHKYIVHRPLEFLDYNKDEAKKLLIDKMGWRDYGGKHYESVFTKFFQAHYLPTKFGFDKRRAHLSSLIVSGQMTREEAVAEMNQPIYDPEELKKDTKYFIKKLGFSENEWNDIMNAKPLEHSFYKTDRKPELIRKYIIGSYKKFKGIN